jgi:hypothetical protein
MDRHPGIATMVGCLFLFPTELKVELDRLVGMVPFFEYSLVCWSMIELRSAMLVIPRTLNAYHQPDAL